MQKKMTGRPTVSAVVTAHNDEATIERVVLEAIPVLAAHTEAFEVIVVDDASADETGAVAERLAATCDHVRVVRNEINLGFGGAYLQGVAAARFDYVALMCGDGGLPTASLPPILELIGRADIVIPYMRNLKAIKSPLRYAISRAFTGYVNWLTGLKMHYYNGLAVHRRELVRHTQIDSTGFGFQAELLVKLINADHDYVEVAVDGRGNETRRSTFLRPRNVMNVLSTCMLLVREIRRSTRAARLKTRDVRTIGA